MPVLSLQGLTKTHRVPRGGEVTALHSVSMEIPAGEFLVVVGPSGSGKTSLLRLIAGLDAATSGDVRWDGRSLRGVSPGDRGMAMVFQDHPLFPHRNVEENLSLGLELQKVAGPERTTRVSEVMALLQLESLRERRPETLSGGERQRVALGMALVKRPAVLLLDEPLAHLDARWRQDLRREFRALQRRLGLTWIQVTHDQSEAMALADRMVVLERGAARQVGTPEEIYDRPADTFVAGFLGSPGMNLLNGTLEPTESAGWRFRLAGGSEIVGTSGDSGSAAEAKARVLGVRPEAMRVDVSGEGSRAEKGEVFAEGVVGSVEPAGHETWVHVRLGTGDWLLVRRPGRVRWAAGQQVVVTIREEAVHWFDPESGRRIG